ncbi:MAG: HIT family protein [Chloroflexi bacterium]|nr:HIT family protein [Chloroflexota bacterium]
MNPTMKKFGYPESRVKEFETWVVLLRPQQITLGALVLACAEPATAFSGLSSKAFTELHEIIGCIERGLARAFAYDKINYLMLMMVDLDVHFHVVPRYAQNRSFAGREFRDSGWPGPPDFTQVNATGAEINESILAHLKSVF